MSSEIDLIANEINLLAANFSANEIYDSAADSIEGQNYSAEIELKHENESAADWQTYLSELFSKRAHHGRHNHGHHNHANNNYDGHNITFSNNTAATNQEIPSGMFYMLGFIAVLSSCLIYVLKDHRPYVKFI